MKQKIIIVGGLSAGPSAAAKARREDEEAEIILFEKTHYISYATCGIPYALSGKVKNREQLMVVQPDLLRNRFNIDLHLNEPVLSIDPDAQKVSTAQGEYKYDKLIYATGGLPLIPPIQNLDQCDLWSTCKTIEDFDKITKDDALKDKTHIAIIGAGLIGLEAAENLSKLGKKVHIIEKSPHVLPILSETFSRVAQQLLRQHDIHLHLNKTATALDLMHKKLTLDDGSHIEAEYLIIGIGVRPNTDLLPDAEKAPNGALIVDDQMQTSLPNIYAAGDCVVLKNLINQQHQYFPMGTHSNKGGRTAGAQATGNEAITFKGAYGTAIVQIFDHAFGKTGMVPAVIHRGDFPYEKTLIVTGNTPGFYPDPSDVTLCIYYEADTEVIVGAEAYGKRGIDKRIDVLSTAIYAKLTLKDLQNLDLAYAPPFAPAKDPVVIAGYAGDSERNGRYQSIFPLELADLLMQQQKMVLIDVRNPDELEKQGKIAGAKNIPLDTLRTHLHEIPKDQPLFLYCARGLRGYVATKILVNNGFENLHNLAGGFLLWRALDLPITQSKQAAMTP